MYVPVYSCGVQFFFSKYCCIAATRRGGSVTERRSAPAPVRCRPECQLGGDDGEPDAGIPGPRRGRIGGRRGVALVDRYKFSPSRTPPSRS